MNNRANWDLIVFLKFFFFFIGCTKNSRNSLNCGNAEKEFCGHREPLKVIPSAHDQNRLHRNVNVTLSKRHKSVPWRPLKTLNRSGNKLPFSYGYTRHKKTIANFYSPFVDDYELRLINKLPTLELVKLHK